MGKETIYTCDGCNKRVKDTVDLTTVKLIQEWQSSYTSTASQIILAKREWCTLCLAKNDMKPRDSTTQNPTPAKPPTFEEVIRGLIQEEILADRENS